MACSAGSVAVAVAAAAAEAVAVAVTTESHPLASAWDSSPSSCSPSVAVFLPPTLPTQQNA